MSKKNYHLIAFFVGLLGIFLGVLYMNQSVKNSVPYRVAYQFIEKNQIIIGRMGVIKSINYYPFGHQMIDRGSSGYAEFRFDLNTDKGELKVFCELTKRLGGWEVENAIMEISNTGERFQLEQPSPVEKHP